MLKFVLCVISRPHRIQNGAQTRWGVGKNDLPTVPTFLNQLKICDSSEKMVKAGVSISTMSYEEAMGWNDDSGYNKEGGKKLCALLLAFEDIESCMHTHTVWKV